MICFKDKSYCSAKCFNMDCHRQYTKDEARQADIWWNGHLLGPTAKKERTAAPVAFADYSYVCDVYQPEEK